MAGGLVAVAVVAALLPSTACAVYCELLDPTPWNRITLLENIADHGQCQNECDKVESECHAVSYESKTQRCALLGQANQQKGVVKRCSVPQSIEKRYPGNNCPTEEDHTTQAANEQSTSLKAEDTTTTKGKSGCKNCDPTQLGAVGLTCVKLQVTGCMNFFIVPGYTAFEESRVRTRLP